MPFIGLTGGLGAGKTTVLSFFKKAGAHTISADRIVHQVLKKPAIIKKITGVLGKDILTKKGSKVSVNKKKMAEVIFNEPLKRTAVEKIIHPVVMKTAQKIKTEILNRENRAVIVFEVPLLFEAGYKKLFDRIIVVHCKRAVALDRLEQQGFTKEEAIRRMRAQGPVSYKKKHADFLIDNNQDIKRTSVRVDNILKALRREISSGAAVK